MIGSVILGVSTFPAFLILFWAMCKEAEWAEKAHTVKEGRDAATLLLAKTAYLFSAMGFGIHLGAVFAVPHLDLIDGLTAITPSYVALALLLWIRKREKPAATLITP